MRYELREQIIGDKVWYRITDTQALFKIMDGTLRFYVSRTRYSNLATVLDILHKLNDGQLQYCV